MRTTPTIDDDVAAMLDRVGKLRDGSFKDFVNEALRRGLREMTAPFKAQRLFQTGAVDLGLLVSLLGFLRLVTNPRTFERPERIADAWTQVLAWLACPQRGSPPTDRHAEMLSELIGLPGIHGI